MELNEFWFKKTKEFVKELMVDIPSEIEKESFTNLLFNERIKDRASPKITNIGGIYTDKVLTRLYVICPDQFVYTDYLIKINNFLIALALM